MTTLAKSHNSDSFGILQQFKFKSKAIFVLMLLRVTADFSEVNMNSSRKKILIRYKNDDFIIIIIIIISFI
jgi:hypothetical protein